MSFTASEIRQLEAWLSTGNDGAGLMTELRARFPGRSLTRCDADDMGMEEPFRSFQEWEVYLVDGRSSCWRCTNDPGAATGLVLARKGKGR